jgi:hypothetical protein
MLFLESNYFNKFLNILRATTAAFVAASLYSYILIGYVKD